MGLQKLVNGAEKLRNDPTKAPALRAIGFGASAANYICLDEFLTLIATSTQAITQFRTLLVTLIATANQTAAGVELILAQLRTANEVSNVFIQNFRGTATAVQGQAARFPFDSFKGCPAVQATSEFLKSSFTPNDPGKYLPGNAGKLAKKYKQSKESIKELEFRVRENLRKIQRLERHIDKIRVWTEAWQVIVDAIDEQFLGAP